MKKLLLALSLAIPCTPELCLARGPSIGKPSLGAQGTQEMTQALNITGQSRSVTMGLLFEKKKDKLSFGTPRTDYRDKVSVDKIIF